MTTCPLCLPCNSVGRCARCGHHGPGPWHACSETPASEYCDAHRGERLAVRTGHGGASANKMEG